ncbi:MAG: DUF4416 family protein, partial [Planctomycetota bacterium]
SVMGSVRPPQRAKLFCGLLSSDVDLLAEARRRLATQLGPIDQVSGIWPFDCTDYYRDELGDDIKRQFLVFQELFSVERLQEVKRLTNALEEGLSRDTAMPAGLRPVNIDPGYLTLSKLVLATTKDYAHRLYVGGGIYAEVTLHYERGDWKPRPWTYPDYAADTYRAFFRQAREAYKQQLAKQ